MIGGVASGVMTGQGGLLGDDRPGWPSGRGCAGGAF